MLKLILSLMLLFSVSCSDKSSTKEILKDTHSGLLEATSYHDYQDDIVVENGERLKERFKKSPDEVCDTFENKKTEDLIHFYDVLEYIKNDVSCAEKYLTRINNYYDNYFTGAISKRSTKVLGFANLSSLRSSEVYIKDPLSLPTQKQLPSKVVNLSFDDGPHPMYTERILNSLKQYQVRANFYVLGKNSKTYPDQLKKAASENHSIGVHTINHKNLPTLSFDSATKEIIGAFDIVEAILGGVDPFFRFPYGSRTTSLRNFLMQNNITDFFWNVDTLDWKYKNPDYLLEYALNQTLRTGRGIVLFHDIQPQTAAILPEYLRRLDEAGYQSIVYLPE